MHHRQISTVVFKFKKKEQGRTRSLMQQERVADVNTAEKGPQTFCFHLYWFLIVAGFVHSGHSGEWRPEPLPCAGLRARGIIRMEFWKSVRRQRPGELWWCCGGHYQL